MVVLFCKMESKLLHEIIPLTQNDCFTVFTREKTYFDFPIHFHEEYELNFIVNGAGLQRIVGDHVGTTGDIELVLVGPNLEHAWFTQHANGKIISEVTIQFHKDLLDEKFLRRNQLSHIRNMFDKSSRGIRFGNKVAAAVKQKILLLHQRQGFDGVIALLEILNDLSRCTDMQLLSDSSLQGNSQLHYNSRRIEHATEFMRRHFDRAISLGEVAREANMTPSAFSRYFKSHTGINFIDSLNNIRLGHATKMLIDTNRSVAEIAFQCGFNNISNFNRTFKRRKGLTPKAFREEYVAGTRVFI